MTKAEIMFELVEEWKSSNLSQKVFCQENRINVSTFAYWIAQKKRMQQPSGGFMPIEVGNEIGQKVEIIHPNGVRLAVASYLAYCPKAKSARPWPTAWPLERSQRLSV